MASEKQIAANRRNAQKSTGPKSPEGKKKVAQNRTKHGFAGANHIILPGEDPSAYDSILATLMREWEPESEAEAFQIEVMAQSQWRLLRAARYERQAFSTRIEIDGPDSSFPSEVEDLSRYEARIARAYYRALATLRSLQAAGRPDPDATTPAKNSSSNSTEPPSAPQPTAETPAPPPPTADGGSSNSVNHLPVNANGGRSKPIRPEAATPRNNPNERVTNRDCPIA